MDAITTRRSIATNLSFTQKWHRLVVYLAISIAPPSCGFFISSRSSCRVTLCDWRSQLRLIGIEEFNMRTSGVIGPAIFQRLRPPCAGFLLSRCCIVLWALTRCSEFYGEKNGTRFTVYTRMLSARFRSSTLISAGSLTRYTTPFTCPPSAGFLMSESFTSSPRINFELSHNR